MFIFKNETGPDFLGARWFFRSVALDLRRDYVGRTRAFLALSDLELNPLTFIKTGIAGRLDFGMMNEQVLVGIIGGNKSKTFFSIKPFYCTCTHCLTPWPSNGHKLRLSVFLFRIFLRDQRIPTTKLTPIIQGQLISVQ